MNHPNMRTLDHDGLVFHYNIENIRRPILKAIGFYIDHAGIYQSINRKSLYGVLILNAVRDAKS